MNILSSFATLVSVTLIGIAAGSAWSGETTPNEPAKPAVQTPGPTTGVAPGWYPPPPGQGGYPRPWQQPSQWPVPPPYPPPGQYRVVPATAAVNPLSAELKQTQEQLTAKNTELDITHTMLEQLRGTLQRSVATERALRKKVADITREQQALQARVIELTAVLNTTTAALEQQHQQSTNDQEQNRTLTAEHDRLRSNLASQGEQLATVHAELEAATQALQQAQAETSTASQQLSESMAQAETVNNELTELKTQLENQKTTLLNAEQTRTEERDRLHNDLASRDTQLATVQAELQTAREALQQAQAETFNNELIELKAQLDSQKTTWLNAEQTRTLTAERDRLHSDLASRDEQLVAVQAELQAAKKSFQQAQAESSIAGQERSEARSQTETLNNELTELKAQLENQKTTLLNTEQTRTEERDSLRNDLASQDEQLATVHAELQVATQALQQTQAEASTSAQQLSAARSQAEAANNELTELKAQLENQKTTLLDAEQTLAAEIDERDGLQENLATCNRELTQAQAALTDAQSVEDALRQAPPTAAGVTAMQTAPTDTDEDGVSDSIDLCPETLHGIAVNSTGCAADVAINLDGVNFLYNSHELTDEARGILDRVADSLIQLPELRLEVAGHTDATGDPTYNQELSMQRAEAVRDYLVAQGANPRYIGAAGYGGQRPIADNTTLEGLQQNRRVELRILQ